MFTATHYAAQIDATLSTEGLLIPTHIVSCATDGSVVALTVGPFGRCGYCEVLTEWLTSDAADHICTDCQGDLDWSEPLAVADLPFGG